MTHHEHDDSDDDDAPNSDHADDIEPPDENHSVVSHPIEPAVPDEFGLVQVWWGDGKGKTTAAIGMGVRAVGHGYRVHMLQFLKGGAASVEDVRGEYNAIDRLPGFTYENLGHYGWHGMLDGSDDDEHATQARAGLKRARELVTAADSSGTIPLAAPPDDGCHMLILDEILYATDRELVAPADVIGLVESKPDDLELVLTGGHTEPDYIYDHADLVTRVRKEKHPLDRGQPARKGTEY